jgi:probable DNA repair protein
MSIPGWNTPDVVPWSAWLLAVFRDLRDFGALHEPRACLDDCQAAALWEQVFAEDPLAGSLLMPGGAVDGFREAWSLAHEWRLPWKTLQERSGEDCRAFLRLAARYQDRLAALGFLDRAQLPLLIAPALAGRPGPEVLFAGFDDFTPVQALLIASLGARVRVVRPVRKKTVPSLTAYPDSRHELTAAAAWARRRLDQDPGARLGIVVPDLDLQASLLEDLLDEALMPERLLPGHPDTARPWNLSLGRPLADAPVVAAAFQACGLLGDSLELAAVSRMLRSPFFGGAIEEGGQRALLETWLREHASDRVTPGKLSAWLGGQDRAPGCPRLATGVQAFLREMHDGARRRRPSEWSAALTRGLRQLGWPGDTPPDSATWQALQAWADLLETFARLDAVAGVGTLGEAIARLRRIAAEQRFQPETPDVPVQVMGLLETAGLEFDALWLSGLHDGVLPAPLRPCALLPASLQRERGMPRACPDTELAKARRLIQRLAGAAPEVRCSYPQLRQDEPLRPSPVVAAMPAPVDGEGSVPAIAAAAFAARRLEVLADDAGPPVAGEVSGGTGLLAAQSACPFRAFAMHRLAARELEAPGAGVDGAARGLFVHRALHLLWEQLRDLAGLAALDAGARAGHVRAALEQAAAETLAGLPPALVRIEIDEAALRIGQLLEIERSRPDFEVMHREQRVAVALGPLRINGQVDRVDRVAGGCTIIDYKTGVTHPADWDSERPAEPQMPLYALAFADELAGLAYASLKPGAVGLAGLARSAEVFGAALPKLKPPGEDEWRDKLAGWRRVLEALAEGFGRGDARVDPTDSRPGGTCKWCHLATLCRRDELLRTGALGDD